MDRERLLSLTIVLAVSAIITYVGWDQPGYWRGGYWTGGVPGGIAILLSLLLPLSLIWFGDILALTNRPRLRTGTIFPGTEATWITYRFVGWVVLLLFAFIHLFLSFYK